MVESPSVFERIVAREIPADIVFESDSIIAFRDIAPQAPVHLVIVPKTPEFANVGELAAARPDLLAEVVSTAQALAHDYTAGQYRLVFNTGTDAGQTIFHVHAHLLGGALGESLPEGTLAR